MQRLENVNKYTIYLLVDCFGVYWCKTAGIKKKPTVYGRASGSSQQMATRGSLQRDRWKNILHLR